MTATLAFFNFSCPEGVEEGMSDEDDRIVEEEERWVGHVSMIEFGRRLYVGYSSSSYLVSQTHVESFDDHIVYILPMSTRCDGLT